MARTISGNNTSSITLASGDSPVTITGTINVTAGNALYGPATGAPWTVTNSGAVSSSAVGGNGITLVSGSVVNTSAGLIGSTDLGASGDAVIIGTGTGGGAGIIDNSGLLSNNNSASATAFVAELDSSGTIINRAGGTIVGNLSGVGIKNQAGDATAGSVSNSGAIIGSASTTVTVGYGVAVIGGMVVTNNASAAITNFANGVDFVAYENTTPGTLLNSGTISDNNGVVLGTGGNVTNSVGGVINATNGTGILGANTIVNYGSIGSQKFGDAIDLAGGGLLVAKAGATFGGVVNGGTTGTLELGTGATFAGLGLAPGFISFGDVTFDTGAEKISGSATGVSQPVFTGFTSGDTISIINTSDTISSFSGGTLTLGGTSPTTMIIGTSFTGVPNATIIGTGGTASTDITIVPCFRAGTRILTDAGEVAVEDLRAGMRVVSLTQQGVVPITWVGLRKIDCSLHPRPRQVWPVRIAAGAFGAGAPHRDLYLSPDHALFLEGALVPVRYLINGASVAQVACDAVEYFHVELEEHGALLADGLPAESYLDTGNRDAFAGDLAVAGAAARSA